MIAHATTSLPQECAAEPDQLTRRVLNCARIRLLIVAVSMGSFFLFLVIAHWIIVAFAKTYAELLAAEPLPGLTQVVIELADLFGNYVLPGWPFLVVFGLAFVVVLLACPTRIAKVLLLRVTFLSSQLMERLILQV